LHDIYAKVNETAASRGWDGVDLLIIGGDFQVRLSSFSSGSILDIFLTDFTNFSSRFGMQMT
jgi:hypothetical protein